MAKIKSKSNKSENSPVDNSGLLLRLREGLVLLLGAAAIFLIIALFSYHEADMGWSYSGNSDKVQNVAGEFGSWSADVVFSWFGFFGYTLPFLLGWLSWMVFRERDPEKRHLCLSALRYSGAVMTFLSGSGIASILLQRFAHYLPQGAGGIVGDVVANWILPRLHLLGGLVVLWAGLLIGLTWFCGVSWIKIFAWFGRRGKKGLLALGALLLGMVKNMSAAFAASRAKAKAIEAAEQKESPEPAKKQEKIEPELPKPVEVVKPLEKIEPVMAMSAAEPPVSEEDEWIEPTLDELMTEPEVEFEAVSESEPEAELEPEVISKAASKAKSKLSIVEPAKDVGPPDVDDIKPIKPKRPAFEGKIPSITLLDKPEPPKNKMSQKQLEDTAKMVEIKLADFGISAKVVGVCPGPIVTRYELELAPGVKVSKLAGLNKDLARALSAMSVRVVETIPGKSVVGIEIPNQTREMVRLREVLDTDAFRNSHSPLMMALGKDIAGHPEQADLAKMPHLLVAGTTGSGKSVGLNAMLLSFLFKATPDEIRMIMIDPKMLELSIYEGIPHLLTPVVTDMTQAANALRWCVKEMDRRYRVMAAEGVRNIAGMNQKIHQARDAGTPLTDPTWKKLNPGMEGTAPELEPMPYIVVLVDEFADMIMVVGKKVEELICRLAQKARAAGIHLILATQRPSVDVITGLIKANVPTRIAFQVSSRIDSRTILDQQGAEQLLGYGDMLYLPPGTGVPTRVHGAFVSDEEVHKVVSAWKALGQPDYLEEILSTAEPGEGGDDGEAGGSGEKDPLYDEAVQIVLETQRASISGVQRRLKIGYNRSARLLEEMEKAGMVSAIQSNGLREILVPTK